MAISLNVLDIKGWEALPHLLERLVGCLFFIDRSRSVANTYPDCDEPAGVCRRKESAPAVRILGERRSVRRNQDSTFQGVICERVISRVCSYTSTQLD